MNLHDCFYRSNVKRNVKLDHPVEQKVCSSFNDRSIKLLRQTHLRRDYLVRDMLSRQHEKWICVWALFLKTSWVPILLVGSEFVTTGEKTRGEMRIQGGDRERLGDQVMLLSAVMSGVISWQTSLILLQVLDLHQCYKLNSKRKYISCTA